MAPVRVAALDVGSNTVHLLVAAPSGRGVAEVCREVAMPRVGAAVNATGSIGAAKTAEVCGLVRRMALRASQCGASTLLFCATEAVRRAADRDAALHAFSDAAGVPCVLLPGEVEARLSFRGAVRMAAGDGLTLVCDVGGGSTELALGVEGRIDALASLPIGSGAATDRWLTDDPPGPEQVAACAAAVDAALQGGAPAGAPQHVVATGGTATSLPHLLGRDAESPLSAADLAHCRSVVAAAPSAAVAAAHGLHPARARVLAGGVEIIDAVRRHYTAAAVRTTIHGLRTGMILAWLDRGDAWVEG
jgi:exopolyphosphatase/guanosine-5'-triphosphate,3'-diphosphate pyrophosphatase